MNITHRQLIEAGRLWLISAKSCNPVFIERTSSNIHEVPDVIGWTAQDCIVIECKISRADFIRDLQKPHRRKDGLGNLRYYLLPNGLAEKIKPENGWGLLVFRDSCSIAEQVRFCNSDNFSRNYKAEVLFLRSRIFEIQRFGQ